MITNTDTAVALPKNSNQALGIGEFAVRFIRGGIGEPAQEVLDRTALFFTDAGSNRFAFFHKYDPRTANSNIQTIKIVRSVKFMGVSCKTK